MRISAKQYAQTLYELTDGKTKSEIEKSVADFARYIYKERKLKLADKIIDQFRKIYNEKNDIVEAEVVSAKKLESPQVGKVKSYVKEKYGAKEVILKNTVDDSIKGGIILKVGDEVVDESVKGKLNGLKNILVS